MKTLKVGDRVKNSLGLKGTILMVEGNEAWVKFDNAKYGCSTWGFQDLTRLRPKRPRGVWVTREMIKKAMNERPNFGFICDDEVIDYFCKELGL